MNKQEFIRELRKELQDIPSKEREEAVQYYEEYFDEAGEENEEAVIRELGSPARIAAVIRRDSFMPDEETKEEKGMETEAAWTYDSSKEEASGRNEYTYADAAGSPGADGYMHYEQAAGKRSWKEKADGFFSGENRGIKIAVAVILCLILIPVLLDAAGVILGIFISAVVIVALPLIIGIALIIAMLSAMAAIAVAAPAVGLYGMACAEGICMMILAVGIVLLIAGIELLRNVIPFFWNTCINAVKWCAGKCRELFA